MRILLVSPHYLPDGGPDAPLHTMLSEALVKSGHSVSVICAVPHYPSGQVLPEYRKKQRTSIENGVQVNRIRIPSLDRSNLVQRMAQYFFYQVGGSIKGLALDYDVALFINPWLTCLLPFAVLGNMKMKPAVYTIYDVYPDVGITSGIFRNRFVIKIVTLLEKYCLDSARIVHVISDTFRPRLKALGVPDDKMRLINIWVDTKFIHPMEHKNGFACEYGLDDKFVVLYAGNIGLSQGLEIVLDAAELLHEQLDIRFVFVGDGASKGRLEREAQNRRLRNVQFIPLQDRSRLPDVLATADLSLVSLQKGIGLDSLPSKSLSILASGRPIVACIDDHSELSKLVSEAQAGICVSPDNPNQLADAIINLKGNPQFLKQCGENGREYAIKHFSPEIAAEKFEEIFNLAIHKTSF